MPNTTESITVVVEWQGEYFKVRDALEELSPRLFTGSGTMLEGSSPVRDASFECSTSASAIRLSGKILKWNKDYKKHAVKNLTIHLYTA